MIAYKEVEVNNLNDEEHEIMHTLYLNVKEEVEQHLFKLLLNAHGYDQGAKNLMIKIKTEEEFIKIVKTSIINAYKDCNYESIIIETLIELQDELPHFKIKTTRNEKSNNAKS